MTSKGSLLQALLALPIILRGYRRRWWSSLNAALGSAVVVGVLVAILSIGAGYSETMRFRGDDDDLMVLRAGAASEMESSLTAEQVGLILHAPVITDSRQARAAAEVYAVASAHSLADARPLNMAVRGVTGESLASRPQMHITEGRMFAPGRKEVIVGRLAQRRFGGLRVGEQFDFAGNKWTVVGTFAANGGVSESEVWTDVPTLQQAYRRGDTYQLVVVRPPPGLTAEALEAELVRDPRLNVAVTSERAYYDEQGQSLRGFVQTLGYGIVALMSLGAIFATLNTGLAQVKSRARVFATLNVLGWTKNGLTLAVAAESLCISLAGAGFGALAAKLAFDGSVVSTVFYSKDFSQVVFTFLVDGTVLLQAVAVAVVVGLLGTVAPAMQVRRLAASRILADRR